MAASPTASRDDAGRRRAHSRQPRSADELEERVFHLRTLLPATEHGRPGGEQRAEGLAEARLLCEHEQVRTLVSLERRDPPGLPERRRELARVDGTPAAVRTEHDHEPPRSRAGEQLRDRALEPRTPSLEQRDPVCETAHLLDALGRPQHRRAPLDRRPHEIAHRARALRIEVVRRLVDEQHRGSVNSARATDTRFCIPCENVLIGCDPTSAETDRGKRGRRTLDVPGLAKPVETPEEEEILGRRETKIERPVPGRHEADEGAHRPNVPSDVDPGDA